MDDFRGAGDLTFRKTWYGGRDDRGRKVMVHGFRSTYRVWAMERTQVSVEIAEAVLAHVPTDQTVRAYARSDVFVARREHMQHWAEYVWPLADGDGFC